MKKRETPNWSDLVRGFFEVEKVADHKVTITNSLGISDDVQRELNHQFEMSGNLRGHSAIGTN